MSEASKEDSGIILDRLHLLAEIVFLLALFGVLPDLFGDVLLDRRELFGGIEDRQKLAEPLGDVGLFENLFLLADRDREIAGEVIGKGRGIDAFGDLVDGRARDFPADGGAILDGLDDFADEGSLFVAVAEFVFDDLAIDHDGAVFFAPIGEFHAFGADDADPVGFALIDIVNDAAKGAIAIDVLFFGVVKLGVVLGNDENERIRVLLGFIHRRHGERAGDIDGLRHVREDDQRAGDEERKRKGFLSILGFFWHIFPPVWQSLKVSAKRIIKGRLALSSDKC